MTGQEKKRPRFSETEGSGSSVLPRTGRQLAAPSPVAMAKPKSTAVKATTTSPSPSPATAPPSPVATKTSPAITAPSSKAVMEPQNGGVLEQAGGAVVGVPAEEKPIDGLTAKNKEWLHCAACPGALKPPISMCRDGLAVCCDCAGANTHCGECGRAATYIHVPCMDRLVATLELPCPYNKFGCGASIAYHAVAEHQATCAHAPCYCLGCAPLFEGSPASLVRHLTEDSGRHRWPAPQKIKYGTEKWLFLPASSPADQRLLLVGEDDGRVFLLALGAGAGASAHRPVTLVCVRGTSRPVYKGTLTVKGPPDEDDDDATLEVTARVRSCPFPDEVDMEGGRLNAHVGPKMLHAHGESVKVRLGIRITKLP